MEFRIFTMAAMLVFLGFGQAATDTVERVFHVTTTPTEQIFNEMVTAVRSILEIGQISADPMAKTISLRGTREQIAGAEWLFNELDRQPSTSQSQDRAVREYRLSGDIEGLIRVFHVGHTATVQQFQEVAVAVRTTSEIRRLFTYNALNAIVARGTEDQIALTEWLLKQLDQAPGEGLNDPAPHEYKMTGTRDFAVRVFFLKNPSTVQEFQEVSTLIRAIGEIRWAFTCNAPKALVLRGVPEQIALAEWIVNVLDRPVKEQADLTTHEYKMPGASDDVVRVFYLPATESVQHFQNTVKEARNATKTRRVFTYNAPRAAVFRGTGAQIASAEQILEKAP